MHRRSSGHPVDGNRVMNTAKTNARLFFQGAVLSYIALFAWLRPSQYLATKVFVPLGQIIFFTFLGLHGSSGLDADFYIIGNSVQLAALSGIFGVTMSVGGERWSGTLPYLFGTPANRLALFIGRSIVHILDGVVGVFIGLTWGVFLMGLDLSRTDPIALILVVLITSFSTAGMGLLLGSLSLVTRNVMFINNTVYFLMLVLTGANVPLYKLPEWAQSISSYLPLTRGIAASRAITEGESFRAISPILLEEILIGIVYIALGYLLFSRFELIAKRRGTLEVF